MVTTVAADKTKYTVTLLDNGLAQTLAVTGTPAFSNVCVQIAGSGGGDSFDLQGSLDGTTFATIGTLVDGTQGTLAGPGFLFYNKGFPMKLRLVYTATAVVPDVTATFYLLKQERQHTTGY